MIKKVSVEDKLDAKTMKNVKGSGECGCGCDSPKCLGDPLTTGAAIVGAAASWLFL